MVSGKVGLPFLLLESLGHLPGLTLMDLTPASELSLRELSTLFARSFEGYFVTVPDAPLLFDARVRTEHISLEDSFLGAGFTSQALTQLELAHSLSL